MFGSNYHFFVERWSISIFTTLFDDAFVVNMMVLLYMGVAPQHIMWRYYCVKLEGLINCRFTSLVRLLGTPVGCVVMNTWCCVVR